MREDRGMPSFLPSERARFYVQANGLPVAVLTIDPNQLEVIDAPVLTADTPPTSAALDGWSVLPKLVMTVVEGPGDVGFLVGGDPSAIDAMAPWVEAAKQVAGAFVVFSPPSPNGEPVTNAALGARGGFVRLGA